MPTNNERSLRQVVAGLHRSGTALIKRGTAMGPLVPALFLVPVFATLAWLFKGIAMIQGVPMFTALSFIVIVGIIVHYLWHYLMKSYLFTYSPLCADWHAQAILNETNAVTTWVQPFPNAAIIISSLDAKDLGAVLRSRLGATWFLITEIHGTSVDGLLPGNLWQFINSAPTTALPTFAQYLPAVVRSSHETAQP